MAIELRKSIPDPELNSRIWGTTINPDSYYRVLGETGADGWDIYKDVLQTGQVRGSPRFGGDAYFSKGAPQGIYLHNQSNLKDVLQHWSQAEAGNNNFLIEATNRFNPETNPLYNPSPKDFIYDGTIESTKGRVGYSKWITIDPDTGKPVPTGTYSYASPRQWNDSNAPSFLQRINPANQRGLKMSQAYTPMWQGASKGFEDPVTWRNLFDYTKGFSETSIPQHARNAVHIAKTIASQPEVVAINNSPAKYLGSLGALRGTLGATQAVTLGAGAVLTPFQIANQISDANNADPMISAYRGSDPFSIRAVLDLGLDATGIGGSNPSEALRRYNTLVNDPRYIEMNPVSSMVGQGLRGNPEYLKSFLNNLAYYGDGAGWIE